MTPVEFPQTDSPGGSKKIAAVATGSICLRQHGKQPLYNSYIPQQDAHQQHAFAATALAYFDEVTPRLWQTPH